MTSSVSHIGEGLSSCMEVPELQQLTSLRSLCLHGNNISRIEGVQQLHGLQDLNLSSNCITRIENLGGIASLTSINLASNRLTHVSGLSGLLNLTHINLSYNGLTSLAGLADLHGPQCRLRQLDVRHNQLGTLQAFSVLVGCISLRDLSICGNPVVATPNHQQVLLSVVPQLASLDGVGTAEVMAVQPDMEAAQQFAAERLHQYDAVHAEAGKSGDQWQDGTFSNHSNSQQTAGPASSSQLRHTPHVDAAMAGYYQRQDGARQGGSGAATQQQGAYRQPANWGNQNSGGGGSSRRYKPGDGVDSGRSDQMVFLGSTGSRVYIVDAAVQTVDVSSGQVKRLQAESALLREQLTQLTGWAGSAGRLSRELVRYFVSIQHQR